MRKTYDEQKKFGQIDIANIQFDLRSRDEITKLLMGLQHLFCNQEIREKIFSVLNKLPPKNIDKSNGRPGMDLWKIFVLGTLRLNCNWDFDKVHNMANNHKKIRQMIGHSSWEDDYYYPLQTIKDNISLFSPEILDEINQIVVKEGHKLVKKKEEILKGRCDSFVVETNVHYPTDINLLFDAIRKVITLVARVCEIVGLTDWRQSKHNIKKVKRLYRKCQKTKRSTSKDDGKKLERDNLIKDVYRDYIDLVSQYLTKAKQTIENLCDVDMVVCAIILNIKEYIQHSERQIDQIIQRVINEEKIPHNEKVFSIFETHTEWICKGKAGVPVELGIRVCILEDQYGFLLNHKVMQKETDEKVAISIVKDTKERFPKFDSCSFDKGFYSPFNREKLFQIIRRVILPKKGRLSLKDKEIEYSEDFKKARRQHSAVESSINALENHALDRCPDHGIIGFKRYVALAIGARNIQILGNIIQHKEFKRLKRQNKLKHIAAA